MLQLSPLVSSIFSLLIITTLLLNFIIVGSRWLKNYVVAFAMESCVIAIISAGIAYFAHVPDLYWIAGLTFVFRGIVFPHLLNKMVNKLQIKHELHSLIPASSSIILSVLLVVFSFVVATHLAKLLHITTNVLVLAIIIMFSMKLTGFLLLAIRDQAISKVLALLVLENGIFLGSLFLVPAMPILIELVILFDLLIVVASFGILVRYLQTHVGSTSTRHIQRLVG